MHMHSLLDVISNHVSNHVSLSEPLFLLALCDTEKINRILNKRDLSGEIIVSKTAKSLMKQSSHLHLIGVVETTFDDILWEDEDTAQIKNVSILTILDAVEMIRKYGQYVNLEAASLKGAHLEAADLRGANLKNCDLQGANLARANLKGACLEGANLQGCNLNEANLFGADLTNTDLRRANLTYAELRNVNMKGTALRGAELWSATLWGTDLSAAFYEGVDLSRADTRGS
ncbi:pentapeptide repeat-containing protein [Bacillus subtilis]